MTDVAVDRLRIRGPDARRLAAVAVRELPAALERSLGDLDDTRLDTITVRLDLDPGEYDDTTLAVLWADAIRVQVLAAGGRTARPAVGGMPGVRTPAGDTTWVPSPGWSPQDVAAAAADWLARPRAVEHLVPRPLLLLARPEVAASVALVLGDAQWSGLVARLRATLAGSARSATSGAAPVDESVDVTRPAPTPDADTRGEPPTVRGPSDPAPQPASTPDPRAEPGDGAAAPELAELARHLDTLGDLVDENAGQVDLTTVTRAAGLALLWPWLADVCREALRSAPEGEPHWLRAHVLARVADPEDPGLLEDPLVRLLAGVPDDDLGTVPAPDTWLSTVDDSAERALAAFAGLLPGFGTSSPRFVRDQWVVRLGLLDATTTPAQLVAATHPLDVLLPKLPYPVSLFKLPWSPPISVRFRP